MVLMDIFFVVMGMVFLFLLLNYLNEEMFYKLNSSMLSVECGFQEMSSFPSSSSNQFFMISVIFVVFDMELLVLLPLPLTFMSLSVKFMIFLVFLIMLLGLFMEWKSNLLKWANSQIKLY